MSNEHNQHEQDTRFPGFKAEYKKDYFKYPTILESWWHSLSGAEQKCLDFIIRETMGFQKISDKISISQFVSGIGTRNKGSGVSKAQVQRVLASLEEKGFIKIKRLKYRTNEISLVIEETAESEKADKILTDEVERMIELFRPISLHRTDEYKKDKRQIKAIGKLIENYGIEMLEQAISLVQITNGRKYSPTITSPLELEKKWANLVMYTQRQQEQRSKISL